MLAIICKFGEPEIQSSRIIGMRNLLESAQQTEERYDGLISDSFKFILLETGATTAWSTRPGTFRAIARSLWNIHTVSWTLRTFWPRIGGTRGFGGRFVWRVSARQRLRDGGKDCRQWAGSKCAGDRDGRWRGRWASQNNLELLIEGSRWSEGNETSPWSNIVFCVQQMFDNKLHGGVVIVGEVCFRENASDGEVLKEQTSKRDQMKLRPSGGRL